MPVFVKGQNPAVSLFNFWDEFIPPSTRWRQSCSWNKWGTSDEDPYSRRAWGERGWGIGRINSSANETGFAYGRFHRTIYSCFVLLPDGRFGLRYLHGFDNRKALSQSTFLHYDRVASRERWSVVPSLDWKWQEDAHLDKQGHVPKLLIQNFGFDLLWELRHDVRLSSYPSGGWYMALAENQETTFRQTPKESILTHARTWLEWDNGCRLKRIDYRENPRPYRPKRAYVEPDIPALASPIVALLRVDEPANNVPHPKVRRLQEATHE
jgi:hypothetical protein